MCPSNQRILTEPPALSHTHLLSIALSVYVFSLISLIPLRPRNAFLVYLSSLPLPEPRPLPSNPSTARRPSTPSSGSSFAQLLSGRGVRHVDDTIEQPTEITRTVRSANTHPHSLSQHPHLIDKWRETCGRRRETREKKVVRKLKGRQRERKTV